MQNKYLFSKVDLQTIFFFQNIISELQLCRFLASNIELCEIYIFLKVFLVFFDIW